jgi:hypothetical protein
MKKVIINFFLAITSIIGLAVSALAFWCAIISFESGEYAGGAFSVFLASALLAVVFLGGYETFLKR